MDLIKNRCFINIYTPFNSTNKEWIRTNLIYFEKATNVSKNWLEFLPIIWIILEEVNKLSFFLWFLLISQNIWTLNLVIL